MARYKIHLKNGELIEADDARPKGEFVDYITRYQHERRTIHSSEVKSVLRVAIGSRGGMRFTGEQDS